MKYSPQIYAKAFSNIVIKSSAKRADLIKNFLNLVKKNNDQHLLKKIYEQVEKIIRKKSGKNKIILETARNIKNSSRIIKKIAKKSDIVEERNNPSLLAGIKIIVNDEMQFDGSMQNKINSLFEK
jgi:F0F1-type ATP synthase delta subunit